jgi:hypothetical protein
MALTWTPSAPIAPVNPRRRPRLAVEVLNFLGAIELLTKASLDAFERFNRRLTEPFRHHRASKAEWPSTRCGYRGG